MCKPLRIYKTHSFLLSTLGEEHLIDDMWKHLTKSLHIGQWYKIEILQNIWEDMGENELLNEVFNVQKFWSAHGTCCVPAQHRVSRPILLHGRSHACCDDSCDIMVALCKCLTTSPNSQVMHSDVHNVRHYYKIRDIYACHYIYLMKWMFVPEASESGNRKLYAYGHVFTWSL